MDIRDKISKLLALADSPNEHEAKAALLKARELMAVHKLQPEDMAKVKSSKVIKKTVGITCTKMTNSWATKLSAVIAEHYCCKAYREHYPYSKKVKIGFIGLEEDFDICTKMYEYAFGFLDNRCKSIKKSRKDIYPSAKCRDMANSYGFGFCSGLEYALKKQKEEHQEWGIVLAAPKEVMDVVQTIGKASSYTEAKLDDRELVQEGYRDGQKFNLSHVIEEDTNGK